MISYLCFYSREETPGGATNVVWLPRMCVQTFLHINKDITGGEGEGSVLAVTLSVLTSSQTLVMTVLEPTQNSLLCKIPLERSSAEYHNFSPY